MDNWETIAIERRAVADMAEGFSPGQWATPSLCDGWTVRDVVAHLSLPLQPLALVRFLPLLAISRGDFHRTNRLAVARAADRPAGEFVDELRRRAESRFSPPGLGPAAPLTEVLIHGEDIRIPLGVEVDRPATRWQPVLDFVVSAKARRGFVDPGLPAIRLVATDIPWSSGTGDEVRGPAAALALAVLRRPARLDRLQGPGAAALRGWVEVPKGLPGQR